MNAWCMTLYTIACLLSGVRSIIGLQQLVMYPSSDSCENGTAYSGNVTCSGKWRNGSVVQFPRLYSEREFRQLTLELFMLTNNTRADINKDIFTVYVEYVEQHHVILNGTFPKGTRHVNFTIPTRWAFKWKNDNLRLRISNDIGLYFGSTRTSHGTNLPRIIIDFSDVICHNGEYIEKTKVCDFHQDCGLGEDESECGETCQFEKGCPWTRTSSLPQKEGFVIADEPDIHQGRFALMRNEDHDEGFEAFLTSPWYGSSGPLCRINFQLYMTGNYVGSVEVKIITKTRNHVIWTQRGDRGTKWRNQVAKIGQVTEPFRVEFTAIRGGDAGFMGLDNLTLPLCDPDIPANDTCPLNQFMCSTGVCITRDSVCDLKEDCLYGEDEIQHCDQLPMQSYCNFEDEGMCGWYNEAGDVFDWTRHKGATPSDHTGPRYDHTYGTLHAYYIYIEVSKRHTGDNAILESPAFPPTPPANIDRNSPYYGSCKLRFFFHMYGENTGSLEVYVVQNQKRRQIFHDFGKDEDIWEKVVVPLNSSSKYTIQIVGTRGLRFRGDIAVDDISLSAECFGAGIMLNSSYTAPKWKCSETGKSNDQPLGKVVSTFTTCGATGQAGPSDQQCRRAYSGRQNVTVTEGIQRWEVPSSGIYRIRATGASGGYGVHGDTCASRGTTVSAYFRLGEGDSLFVLVGQEGECVCCQDKNADVCTNGKDARIWNNTIGGGGGGATYVYKSSVVNGTELLLVAGGGGGGALSDILAPANVGLTHLNFTKTWPGHGGGWNDSVIFNATEESLSGGVGGYCSNGSSISGGFGGGGAGCSGAGGGGGYYGGNAGNGPWEYGIPGSSYISTKGLKAECTPDSNQGAGSVKTELPVCTCEDTTCPLYDTDECTSLCPPGSVLSTDEYSCIEVEVRKPIPSRPREQYENHSSLGYGYLIILVLGGVVFVGFLILMIIWSINYYKRKKKKLPGRLDLLVEEDQLSRLRQGENPIVTEYNPNYDFNGTTTSPHDLREIPRNDLQLVRTLGQGAFGEVYRGLLSGVSREGGKIQVAVKTLPALCTDQAEMDFLMEAIIMSKFRHPNIVRFIGVCFERHPRFIILELLEGGAVKTFLRECRSKQCQESTVTMKELLSLSIDIAKGCQHLEDNHFIHRDIAARNCLLTSKGPHRVAKIADFGMARDIYRSDYYRKGGKAMLPVKWMPPEAFLDGIFTSMTDVWSYGILLWEIFSMGYMPYPGKGNQEVMTFVTAGGRMEPAKNCPVPITLLMKLCWSARPEHRPNFSNILYHLNSIKYDRSILYGKLPFYSDDGPADMRDVACTRSHENERMVLTVQPTIKEADELDSMEPVTEVTGYQKTNFSHGSLDKLLKQNDNNSKIESSIKRTLSLSGILDNLAAGQPRSGDYQQSGEPAEVSKPALRISFKSDSSSHSQLMEGSHEECGYPLTDFSEASEDETMNNSSNLLLQKAGEDGGTTWL